MSKMSHSRVTLHTLILEWVACALATSMSKWFPIISEAWYLESEPSKMREVKFPSEKGVKFN